MLKKVEGIVLTEVPFKESSKIINVLTKEYGLIGMIAKGCKRINSKLMNVTCKLTYGYFYIYYKEDKLSILTEVDVINYFKNIRKDINTISYSTYLLELTNQILKEEANNDIYKHLIDSLIKIDEGFNYKIISNIFEIKMLDYLGIRPVVDECVECGSKDSIVTISSYKGGVLCKNCVGSEKIVNSKTYKLIKLFLYVDISKISKLEIADNIQNEISSFIYDYYDRYSGIYLKSRDFLRELDNLGDK